MLLPLQLTDQIQFEDGSIFTAEYVAQTWPEKILDSPGWYSVSVYNLAVENFNNQNGDEEEAVELNLL